MLPLYHRLSPTKDLKGLAHAVGSQLQEKTKVPTKGKKTKLSSYKWTEECRTLLRESSEATVDEINLVLETRGRKIRKPWPSEMSKGPALWIHEDGSLLVEEDEIIIFTPVQTGEGAKLQTWPHDDCDDCDDRDDRDETELPPGSPVMIFGNVHFGTVPAIPFQVLLIPTEAI